MPTTLPLGSLPGFGSEENLSVAQHCRLADNDVVRHFLSLLRDITGGPDLESGPEVAPRDGSSSPRQFLVTVPPAEVVSAEDPAQLTVSCQDQELPYDPNVFARSVEEALAPVALSSYGGDPYVPGRWTRFTCMEEVYRYHEARNEIFYRWVERIVDGLREAGYAPDVQWVEPGEDEARTTPRQAHIRLPAVNADFEFLPAHLHYDRWTREGVNPVELILRLAQAGSITRLPAS